MNIKKIILFFFIFSFVLSGCTAKTEVKSPETKNQTLVSIADKGLNIKPDKGLEIVENILDFTAVKENQEYNFETDNQNIDQGGLQEACLETKDCYYFCRCNYIYTFDKVSKQYSLLCNKPNCSHYGNLTCNAFLVGIFHAMQYYEGNIYVLLSMPSESNNEKNGGELSQENLELYRMSLDGSERTKVCTVATALVRDDMMDNGYAVRCAAVHRGYLYYIYAYGIGYGTNPSEDNYYANNSNTLYRISLDGKEERECICTVEYGGLASAVEPKFQGSYMYFIKPDITRDGTGYGNLYRLNTESMKLELMNIGEICSFIINEDKIIYITSEIGKYYSYNTKTWEKKVFFDPDPKEDLTYGYMLYDGRYYYFNLFNAESLEYRSEVYNEQLEKVGEYDRSMFEIEDTDKIYADYQPGNSDYDFMIAYDGSVLYYLDKSLLESGTAEFVKAGAE